MNIVCPNCSSRHRGHTPRSLMTPFFVVCAQCATRFLVNWKITLRRKSAEPRVACSWCAKEQDDSDRCAYCGRPFYGYAAGTKRPATRPGSGSPRFNGLPRAPRRLASARNFLLASALLAAIAVAASGWAWRHETGEGEYLANYVVALYGIRSGVEHCSRACTEIAADWKKDRASGRNACVEMGGQELEDLATVMHEVDLAMRKLEFPPQRYRGASEKLQALYGIYRNLDGLVKDPGESLESFTLRAEASRASFTREVKELKESMPPPLTEEFKKFSNRYDLSFIYH